MASVEAPRRFVSRVGLATTAIGASEIVGGAFLALGPREIAQVLVASGLVTVFLGIIAYAASDSRPFSNNERRN